MKILSADQIIVEVSVGFWVVVFFFSNDDTSRDRGSF